MFNWKVLFFYAICLIIMVVGRPSDSGHINLTTTSILSIKNEAAEADDPYRLPTGIVYVSSYDIVIKPDFYNEGNTDIITFSGEVFITGTYLSNVKRLTLHAGKNLRINDVRITYQSGHGVNILSTNRDEEHEFLHINYDSNQITTFYMTIMYTATFSDNIDGFYKVIYKDTENNDRFLLLTDLQPTMARKVFPCFDEPDRKATFKLTIYTPQGYGALSNTPLDKVESKSGTSETLKHVFQRTPPMSTHSLAFMLYEEDNYGSTPFGAITHSQASVFSWALKYDTQTGSVDYSLPMSAKALDALEDFLDFPFRAPEYNISKVDQVVVPNLLARSTPSWGFVTYRADSLLIDPQEATEADKDQAVNSITKGLAQQWFGNLVTPSWWSDAWLTEGMAEYLGYWAMERVHGDWRAMERLVLEQQLSALEDDGWSTAPALSASVSTPREAVRKLGGLTQSKGVSIVMMLRNMMGEGNLQSGLRSFISSKKYKTANAKDLATILQNNLPTNVSLSLKYFFSDWTDNPGYPLVTVTRDYSGGSAEVEQQRFIYGESKVEKYEYLVPLYLRQGDTTTSKFLDPRSSNISFTNLKPKDYVLLTSAGHYRVNYDEGNWALLLEQLKADVGATANAIAPLDRARLVDDSLNLARSGVRNYKDALQLVEYLSKETDYVPWVAAFRGLDFLERMLVNVDTEGTFKKFMLHILSAVYAKLGFTSSGSHVDKLLHEQVLRAACSAGEEQCLKDATATFRKYIDDGIRPDPDLRRIVLCYGIQEGSDEDWNNMYNKLGSLKVETERMAIISGLGCSKKKDTLERYADSFLKDPYVYDSERPSLFAAIYSNPQGVDTVLNHFDNYGLDNILYMMGEKTTATIIADLAGHLITSEQASRMRTLAVDNPKMREELNAAWSEADYNVFWVQSNAKAVIEALHSITTGNRRE